MNQLLRFASLLLFFTASLAVAQADPRSATVPEIPGTNNTSTPAAQRPVTNGRIPASAREPAVLSGTNSLPYCLLPGQIFNITVTESDKPFFRLSDSNHYYPLKLIAVKAQQVSLQIPQHLHLATDRQYQLEQTHNPLAANGRNTGISIRICAVNTAPAQELLLSYADEQHLVVEDSLRKNGLEITEQRYLPALAMRLIKVAPLRSEQQLQSLRAALPFAEIDLNDSLRPAATPRLYHQKLLNLNPANDCPTQPLMHAVKIGIIDGRVEQRHASLQGQTIHSHNFTDNTHAPQQHATQIASILLGNVPAAGFAGLLPAAPLYSAEVLRNNSAGEVEAEAYAVVSALDWLLQQQVRLISVSLVTRQPNRVMNNAFERASQKGAVIFAAVGNDGNSAPANYPAAFPSVIAVTAIDAAQQLYSQANRNSHTDFAAPGVDIWAADTERFIESRDRGLYVTGTSFATPMVMAVAARVLAKAPNTPKAVLMRLLSAASLDLGEPGDDPVYGAGLIQQVCF